MNIKTCTKCKSTKHKSDFSKNKNTNDGLQFTCKKCASDTYKAYSQTEAGVIASIYLTQRKSSKKRGHHMPSYSKKELSKWLYSRGFRQMFGEWVRLGHKRFNRPSVDRLDDYKAYSFDNIQLITLRENNKKEKPKHCKSVNQFSLNGDFLKNHISIVSAARCLGVDPSGITKCCKGKRTESGGFKWGYEND